MNAFRQGAVDAWSIRYLFGCGGSQRSNTSKMAQQRTPASGPDPVDLVQDRLERFASARFSVERDGEAVRFVADPLKQKKGGSIALEEDGILAAW